MFNTYEDIFAQRADSYHEAMKMFPRARQQEFELAVRYLNIMPGNTVCDVPSGGGYLRQFVSAEKCFFQFLETSEQFVSYSPKFADCYTQLCQFNDLPIDSQSIDRIISLAAMHHIQNREQVFSEFARILKPEGKILIADVEFGSNTAGFLNVFVNKYNSMGHVGDFINTQMLEQLSSTQMNVISVNRPRLQWCFDDEISMVVFCRKLFGLDKASNTQILTGVNTYLNPCLEEEEVKIDWELAYILLQLNGR